MASSTTPKKRINYKSYHETSEGENAAKNPCFVEIESSEDLIKKVKYFEIIILLF